MKTKGEAKTLILKSLKINNYPTNYLNVLLEYINIGIVDKSEDLLTQNQRNDLSDTLSQLESQKPIEYITGKASFYNHSFKVNSDVLIPRPDTEYLVEKTIEIALGIKGPLTIIDIGTGSGCIIISIYNALSNINNYYWATDISEKALAVAQDNANIILGDHSIDFMQADVIPNKIPTTSDILIVTNPPYISNEDIKNLPDSVKEYEPDLALRENPKLLQKLQKYIDKLQANQKTVHIAIEYSSKDGNMIQKSSTPLLVSLQELLLR